MNVEETLYSIKAVCLNMAVLSYVVSYVPTMFRVFLLHMLSVSSPPDILILRLFRFSEVSGVAAIFF